MMLSALLLPPPIPSASPLDLRLISSHPSCARANVSETLVCYSTPPRRPRPLSAVPSLPHTSSPLLLYGQRPPLPRASSTNRGPPPTSATSSPPSADPGLWDSLTAAVAAIPKPLLIAIAVGVAVYVVSRVFSSRKPVVRERVVVPPPPPPPPPIQLGEITEDDLRRYDGSDPEKPLLMAVKGQIYDVSQSRLFYGPGGPYALFAGKDASRALAKMSFEEKDLTSDISGLGAFELGALQDWEYKFKEKYVVVGTVKKPDAFVMGTVSTSAAAIGAGGNAIETLSDIAETKEAPAVSSDNVVLEEGNDVVVGRGGSPDDGAVQATKTEGLEN